MPFDDQSNMLDCRYIPLSPGAPKQRGVGDYRASSLVSRLCGWRWVYSAFCFL